MENEDCSHGISKFLDCYQCLRCKCSCHDYRVDLCLSPNAGNLTTCILQCCRPPKQLTLPGF